MKHTDDSDKGQILFGAARVVSFLLLMIAMTIALLVTKGHKAVNHPRLHAFFFRMVCKIIGIRVRLIGQPNVEAPTLFVSNHASYLDVIAMGTVLPAHFVAKADVASWPFFGFLTKLHNTVFIERRSIRAKDQQSVLSDNFTSGRNLILFPEGTSTDGFVVLPFKSSLFGIAEKPLPNGKALFVQPVSTVCTELNGMPIPDKKRPYYSWFGDMTLLPHLWNVFRFGRFTVDVICHPPVNSADFEDRKALAAHCEQQVRRGVEGYLKQKNAHKAHSA